MGQEDLERLIELSSAEPHEKVAMLHALAELQAARVELTEPAARRELAKSPLCDVCPGCGLHMIDDIIDRAKALVAKRTCVCPRCGIRKRAGRREPQTANGLPSF